MKRTTKKKTGSDSPPAAEEKLPAGMEAYLRRASAEFRAGIDRMLAEGVPPTVTPEINYIERLCAVARKEQVNVRVDLRAGVVEVAGQDWPAGFIPSTVGTLK